MDPARADRLGRVQFALTETGLGSTAGLWIVVSTLFQQAPERLAHAQRVAKLSRAIAGQLGLRGEAVDPIERAALAHEIGAVVIGERGDRAAADDETSRGRAAEQAVLGAAVIAHAPLLTASARLVRAVPEWIDGTGQPLGLRGDQIPLGARIVSVADVYDVMDTTCQQLGWPRDLAAVELVRYAGRRFDADVVAAALRVVEAVPEARSFAVTDLRQVV